MTLDMKDRVAPVTGKWGKADKAGRGDAMDGTEAISLDIWVSKDERQTAGIVADGFVVLVDCLRKRDSERHRIVRAKARSHILNFEEASN